MPPDTRSEVVKRLRRQGRGWVFTLLDFPKATDQLQVKKTVARLRRKGRVKRIANGVYYFPRKLRHYDIDVLPEPMKIARAIAKRHGHRVAISGAAAANRFGLTTQVPDEVVFITDGPSKRIQLGKLTITLQHEPKKPFRVPGELERSVILALLYLGQNDVDDQVIVKLRQIVPASRRERVLTAAKRMGGWIGETLKRIATPEANEVNANG